MSEFLEYDKDTDFTYGTGQLTLRLTRLTTSSAVQMPEYIEALIALYHHILPNVPLPELEKDLRQPDLVHLVLLRRDQDVREDNRLHPARLLRRYETPTGEFEDFSDESDPDEDTSEEILAKVEDFIRNRRRSQYEKQVRAKYPGMEPVLKLEKSDLRIVSHEQQTNRIRDLIVGAMTIKNVRLDDFPPTNCAQLLYIGVRTRFQQLKCGRRLMNTAIKFETAHADCLFTYAGADAVRFFRRCGLTDDPLLAGRFQCLDEDWTDAVPMVWVRASDEFAKEDAFERFRAESYKKYAAEAYLVKGVCQQNAAYRLKIQTIEAERDTFEQQLALEKARCIMYEQLVQSLEEQLLANGIQPKVDQEEIVNRVLKKK